MQKVRAIIALLNHPVLSAAGSVYTLRSILPLVVGGTILIVGWVADQSVLVLIGLVLLFLNLLGIGAILVLRRQAESSDTPDAPAEVEVRRRAPKASRQVAPPGSPPAKRTRSQPSLGPLYTEGHKMLKALDVMEPNRFLYRPLPSEAEIEHWQQQVRQALPEPYRHRFHFAPLQTAAINTAMFETPRIESDQHRRLRESIEELERIMRDMDEADGQP